MIEMLVLVQRLVFERWYMMLLLCAFMSPAFCASVFTVPCTWECYEALSETDGRSKVLTMSDPASVGLQACEVRRKGCEETVALHNLKGESLVCGMNGQVVLDGDKVLSVDLDAQKLGEVYFCIQDEFQGCLSVVSRAQEVTIYAIDFFVLWKKLKNLQYDFGEDSLTLRKFLGYSLAGELFVSVTVAYNDFKSVALRCGVGASGWDGGANGLVCIDEGEVVEVLHWKYDGTSQVGTA